MTRNLYNILFGVDDPAARRNDYLEMLRDGLVPAKVLSENTSFGAMAQNGKYGAIATGSSYATDAGMEMLRAGGSSADAAAAAALALMVVDPPNCSPAGRTQIIHDTEGGKPCAIDGTTVAPTRLPHGLKALDDQHSIPTPGAVRAILHLHATAGRLPLETIVTPARDLAREGFLVPENLAKVWQWRARELRDADARRWFLPGGAAPKAGSHFTHLGLARYFDLMIELGNDPFADAVFARDICTRLSAKGVLWQAEDLMGADPLDGEVVTYSNEDWRIDSVGRQGWGHTLLQIVALSSRVTGRLHSPLDAELAHLLAILRAFDDRPQELRSLKPKSNPIPWEELLTRLEEPVASEWREIVALIGDQGAVRDIPKLTRLLVPPKSLSAIDERDTTHLSVIDASGARVSLTQSIGPHFGARVADPEYGILLAHSYRMLIDPEPGARDVTEQCPSLLNIGTARYAIGGAGSERIPGAVAAVVRGLLNGQNLMDAVYAPRANWVGDLVRLHVDVPVGLEDVLTSAGMNIAFTGRGPVDHLGIVQGAGRDASGDFIAAADTAYSGTAQAE